MEEKDSVTLSECKRLSIRELYFNFFLRVSAFITLKYEKSRIGMKLHGCPMFAVYCGLNDHQYYSIRTI